MPFRPRPAAALALLACLAACSQREPFARLSGLLLDGRLREVSGMAASRAHEGVLWMINDGGNDAAVYAVSLRGRALARFALEGVPNTDWEDLAAFELDGKAYLLIADTGDNGGLRRTLQLHVVEEPRTLEDGALKPAWSIAFRWPDGARDCEAAAVDAAAGEVLLVSKKRHPAELFAVPLRPTAGRVAARRLGTLSGVPQAGAEQGRTDPAHARLRGQVSAADLSPDGRTLAVLTYDDLVLYRRKIGEPWAHAIARAPQVRPLPLIPQAEALAWSRGGAGLFATGEFSPAPLFYLAP